MKNYIEILKNKRFHFVGIGGISMSSIAFYMKNNGFEVSGSDTKQSEITNCLSKKGIDIKYFHREENVYAKDVVVFSSAIDSLNPEIVYAKQKYIPVIKRSELLGNIVSMFNESISVSGSHGKTTTTGMIADVFINARKNPTVFLGGESKEYSNYREGKNIVIVEACEYKKNFLDIDAKQKVLLNIDNDHLDSYNGIEDEVATFKKFIKNGVSIVNKDDEKLRDIMGCSSYGFGIENNAEFMAKRLKSENGCYSFDAYAYSRKIGRIKLEIQGRHNVYNALACFSVCFVNKIPFVIIKKTLENFEGIKRRNEIIGEYIGLKCIADYAHHPNEIKATLSALDFNNNDITVFQPHTYSRTKYLMQDFVEVLSKTKKLILYKTYPAREEYDKKGSAKTLFDKIVEIKKDNCFYANSEEELVNILERVSNGNNRILFLGAGDIYEIAKSIIKK